MTCNTVREQYNDKHKAIWYLKESKRHFQNRVPKRKSLHWLQIKGWWIIKCKYIFHKFRSFLVLESFHKLILITLVSEFYCPFLHLNSHFFPNHINRIFGSYAQSVIQLTLHYEHVSMHVYSEPAPWATHCQGNYYVATYIYRHTGMSLRKKQVEEGLTML